MVLTAHRGATTSMLYWEGSIGAYVIDVITLIAFIASIYLAGRIAERRGRRFKIHKSGTIYPVEDY